MNISRDRFLSFARHLALVTSTAAPALAACSGSSSNTAVTTVPTARASESSTTTSSEPPPGDITAGSGPCRCSWDGNKDAAPRVCKKGEVNYDGIKCIPGYGNGGDDEGGYYPPPPVPGPLPPPDFPV